MSFRKASRRFPPPWSALETPGGWKVVDANGVAVAYVYAVDERRRTALGFDVLTPEEARRIAWGIARLPDLMRSGR
jgi:hypothetical protein